VLEGEDVEVKVDDANAGKGMAFMPELKNYDRA
jgi:hypothetical protein